MPSASGPSRVVVRRVPTRKTCQKCGTLTLFEGFAKNKRAKDGLQAWCRECCKTPGGVPEELRQRVQRGSRSSPLPQVCSSCKETKSASAFRVHSTGVQTSQCRRCWNIWRARYRALNKNLYKKVYDAENISRRGVTPEEYDEMLAAQLGGCAICAGPPGGRGRFHIDHDHATGQIRGLLCHKCNTGIGLLQDDPNQLLQAAFYLLRYQKANVPDVAFATHNQESGD